MKQGPRLIFNAVTATGHALLADDPAADTVAWAVDTHTLSQATPLVVGSRVLFGADRLSAVDLSARRERSA